MGLYKIDGASRWVVMDILTANGPLRIVNIYVPNYPKERIRMWEACKECGLLGFTSR